MPMLDQPDEATTPNTDAEASSDSKKSTSSAAAPVSMPSLDDDNDGNEVNSAQEQAVKSDTENKDENSTKQASTEKNEKPEDENQQSAQAEQQATVNETETETEASTENAAAQEVEAAGEGETAGEHHVAMELDEAMQAQVESGQIKFILNENGQLLQLNNHIITDAEGNQILVEDPEQIQQLLQSVGVLQSGDGLDGETLQMMTDGNGQMVLVQGENNETQLIDASLLNAEGQLVIQQGQDGELGEGAHVIGEDGTRIPVSVSYTEDGQPIVQVQQVMEAPASAEGEEKEAEHTEGTVGEEAAATEASTEAVQAETSENTTTASATGGGFFALEDLMQPGSESKTSTE